MRFLFDYFKITPTVISLHGVALKVGVILPKKEC